MKIAQLTPGSGDTFYCQNCLRDVELVRALQRGGVEVTMVPLYLPVEIDGAAELCETPVFFGGVNVYLQQKLALFRKSPRWVDRMFDGRWLLRKVGKLSGMTKAKGLGRMTLSMLRGENGRQAKELDRLVEWLGREANRPEVVVLSNVLLSGVAGRIKAELGTGVVALLQDEDGFIDGLGDEFSRRCWERIAENAGDIDAFISPSEYYAKVMQQRLGSNDEKMHIVRMGVEPAAYEDAHAEVATVGFLSRMSYTSGLDVLIDAFIMLKQKQGFSDVRLKIAGGKTGGDENFIADCRRRIEECDLSGDVEFVAGFEKADRVEFLKSLTVLAAPERQPVAYGLNVLEAMASGVAVAGPAIGAFSEMLADGGGVLYEPNTAGALAGALERVLADGQYAGRLGQVAQKVVAERYDIDKNAAELVRVCETAYRRSDHA